MKLVTDVLCSACRLERAGVEKLVPGAPGRPGAALRFGLCLSCLTEAAEAAGGVVTRAEHDRVVAGFNEAAQASATVKDERDQAWADLRTLQAEHGRVAGAVEAMASEKRAMTRTNRFLSERVRELESGEPSPTSLRVAAEAALTGGAAA